MAYSPFKDKSIEAIAMEYDGSGNLLYLGNAAAGSSKGAASWKIKKFTYSGGSLTDVQYADGNANYDNIWDDRAGLSYS